MMQEDRNGWMKISFTFSKSGWIGYLGRNLDTHFSRGTFKIGNIMADISIQSHIRRAQHGAGFLGSQRLDGRSSLITAPQHPGVNPLRSPASPTSSPIRGGSVLCSNEVLE
jgi:hypothetical protein